MTNHCRTITISPVVQIRREMKNWSPLSFSRPPFLSLEAKLWLMLLPPHLLSDIEGRHWYAVPPGLLPSLLP